MKELVVISGKGGTGKTSITGALAKLARNKVIVDCDVDAADLHILLRPEIIYKEIFIGGVIAEISKEKCIKCNACKEVCRFGAVEENYEINKIDCEGCGVCYYLCKSNAITLKDNINGEWYRSNTEYGPMIHASMTVGSENSGKLVTLLRTNSAIIAKENGINLIVIDGSPGVGCPVIASITSAYCCLIVTEPSLSAFHDLKRVCELSKNFKAKTLVCINKFDINEDISNQIEEFCKHISIGLAGKIPYDNTITKAQIEGKNIMEFPESIAAKAINELWVNLKKILVITCN
ncbi:MAG: 4Fe-4S binding protein [Cyanobacteriota bacterium]